MIEAQQLFKALIRSWRLVLVGALIGGLIAVLIPVTPPPKAKLRPYPWTASSVVGAESLDGFGKTLVNAGNIDFFADSYQVKAAAIRNAGLSSRTAALAARMGGSPTAIGSVNRVKPKPAKGKKSKGGSIVLLEAAGTSSAKAVALVNAYAVAVGKAVNAGFVAYQKALAKAHQSTLPGLNSGYTVLRPAAKRSAILAHPVHKASKVASKKIRLPIGLLGGAVLAMLIVVVRELLDRTLRTSKSAESAFGFPVVAEIPRPSPLGGPERGAALQVAEDPVSAAAEAFRMLRMAVLFEALADSTSSGADSFAEMGLWAAPEKEPYQVPDPGSRKVVLVVSPGTEEGRAVVAANLGATFGEAGERVIVISTADLDSGRRGSRMTELPPPVDAAGLQAELQPSRIANVARLSLRPFVANGGQLVTAAPVIMQAAREIADVVIVEVPPLLAVHHGEALVHAVDVVVVVGECGVTTTSHARRAGDFLRRMGAPVLGVVLTQVRLDKKDIRETVALPGAVLVPSLPTGPEADAIPEATRA